MKRVLIVAAVLAVAGVAGLTYLPNQLLNGTETGEYRDATPIATENLPVHLEDLTWTEVRALIRAGHTTAIVPTGGTEQNGPHMVLGKHNYVVRHTAGKIAQQLGNALVTPVMSYVPEGAISPPTGHMAYPGTISVSGDVFAAVLESTARSLKAHGFRTICFIGDSGGNQAIQAAVAKKLNEEWIGSGVAVLHVANYYSANGQIDWLLTSGESESAIGSHAGIRDTSELLAVHPAGIRLDRRRSSSEAGMAASGVIGDPTRASAEIGEKMLQLKVDAAVEQILQTFQAEG